MTREIQSSFRELLNESDWLDLFTKEVASEKVKAMRLRIGYPDFIIEGSELDERYRDVRIIYILSMVYKKQKKKFYFEKNS